MHLSFERKRDRHRPHALPSSGIAFAAYRKLHRIYCQFGPVLSIAAKFDGAISSAFSPFVEEIKPANRGYIISPGKLLFGT